MRLRSDTVEPPAVKPLAAVRGRNRLVDQTDVPPEVVASLRRTCLALPEAARRRRGWARARRVRKDTFAHVLVVEQGWPPAYARAAATDGPAVVLTFRSSGPELAALSATGPPYFKPPWHPQVVGVVLGPTRGSTAGRPAGPGDDEVAELITESYCLVAPRRLADQVARPSGPG